MFRLARPPEMATVARKLPSVASQGHPTPRVATSSPFSQGARDSTAESTESRL